MAKNKQRQDERTLSPFPPHFFKPNIVGITLVVLALALAGAILGFRFTTLDMARDLRVWQDKLNLIADSRAGAVSEWVEGNISGLRKLADNPSLQVYFAELAAQSAPVTKGEDPAQKTYLRNLLIFSADRLGFSPQSMPMSVQIPTQIGYKASVGIAILDAEDTVMVATPYLTLDAHVTDRLKDVPVNATALIDMYRSEDGKLQLAFVAPVFGIQADPEHTTAIGRVVGVREVDDSFFKLLRHPGAIEKTMEAMLVRADGDRVSYLSPLRDGAPPLAKSLNMPPAEAFAITHPGEFAENTQDYQSHTVLVTSRAIPNTPWTLVLKVDSDEALREGRGHRLALILVLTAALLAVVATVIAVWHVASSRRALFASRYFRDLAERATAQERLLKLVADSQPEAISILDRDCRYRFANRQAGLLAGMPPEAMENKPASAVLGTASAQEITEAVGVALSQGAHSRVRRFNHDGVEHILRIAYVPLPHIPVPGLPEPTPGVLAVEQDVSEVVHEREKRLRMHRELIDTLIMLVDERDPNAANHSVLVARIAHDVAQNMELDRHTVETTRIAGSLMNIGKIVVSTEVLTRRDSLNEIELRSIRDSMKGSAELLQHITFEGPVVETLAEAQEHWDGSGPQGLQGEGILISARIIAVVNAFVGMTSPRSYRPAMPVAKAIDVLMTKVDKQFDRRVVAALAHYIENRGGAALLEGAHAA